MAKTQTKKSIFCSCAETKADLLQDWVSMSYAKLSMERQISSPGFRTERCSWVGKKGHSNYYFTSAVFCLLESHLMETINLQDNQMKSWTLNCFSRSAIYQLYQFEDLYGHILIYRKLAPLRIEWCWVISYWGMALSPGMSSVECGALILPGIALYAAVWANQLQTVHGKLLKYLIVACIYFAW